MNFPEAALLLVEFSLSVVVTVVYECDDLSSLPLPKYKWNGYTTNRNLRKVKLMNFSKIKW